MKRDQRGVVYLETLVAFLPVFAFFLGTLQLADVSVAHLVVQHASSTAARAAVVVLPDDGAWYGDRDNAELDQFKGARSVDVERAADLILRANSRLHADGANVSLRATEFSDRNDVIATVEARYHCLIPALCGSGIDLKAETKLIYQGAHYVYESQTQMIDNAVDKARDAWKKSREDKRDPKAGEREGKKLFADADPKDGDDKKDPRDRDRTDKDPRKQDPKDSTKPDDDQKKDSRRDPKDPDKQARDDKSDPDRKDGRDKPRAKDDDANEPRDRAKDDDANKPKQPKPGEQKPVDVTKPSDREQVADNSPKKPDDGKTKPGSREAAPPNPTKPGQKSDPIASKPDLTKPNTNDKPNANDPTKPGVDLTKPGSKPGVDTTKPDPQTGPVASKPDLSKPPSKGQNTTPDRGRDQGLVTTDAQGRRQLTVLNKACFVAGTPVHTEHGDRPIESIRVGDRVWSRDETTGVVALRPVTALLVTDDRPVLPVQIGDGSRTETLLSTPNHPFWVEGEGWVEASDLGASALLRSTAGALVARAGAELAARTTVYNLEVAGFHTYFVGALHAWVHNDCRLRTDYKHELGKRGDLARDLDRADDLERTNPTEAARIRDQVEQRLAEQRRVESLSREQLNRELRANRPTGDGEPSEKYKALQYERYRRTAETRGFEPKSYDDYHSGSRSTRGDERARRAFRSQIQNTIARNPNHPLRFLLDSRGRLRVPETREHHNLLGRSEDDPTRPVEPGMRDDNPWYVEAGHADSHHSGADEYLGLQDAFENQYEGKAEQTGTIYNRKFVDIGGVPVEIRTARGWEEAGLLPPGTVDGSAPHQGWDVGAWEARHPPRP